jgi:hypothetical protein
MIYLARKIRLGKTMNRAFHFGFLLAVTAHLTFGCCMHHTHAVGSEIESYATIQASCPCGHDDHDHDGDPSHHDGDREPCDEEDCVFAVSTTSSGSSSMLSHAPSVLLVTPLLPITAHERIGNADLTSFRRAAPASLQVLNQAFLL